MMKFTYHGYVFEKVEIILPQSLPFHLCMRSCMLVA